MTFFGIKLVPESESTGLNAAEITYRIGKTANAIASEADEIAPPVCGEARPFRRATLGGASGRNGLGLFECGHRTVSRLFVRQNEIAEMPATMKKMKMDTAAARPYWAPWPAENASLYV